MTINRRSHLANAKILIGQSIIQTELFESPINRGANQLKRMWVFVLFPASEPDHFGTKIRLRWLLSHFLYFNANNHGNTEAMFVMRRRERQPELHLLL
jgi:hypothetical protein